MKRTDDDIDKILKDWGEVFRDLADCIRCAKCGTKVCGQKFNLGPKYHSFEGCEKCANEEQNGKNGI